MSAHHSLHNKLQAKELNLLPVMALFAILIPVLISVAVFQKMAIVDVNLPMRNPAGNPSALPEDGNINLTVAIVEPESGSPYIQIGARGGFLPSIYYAEREYFLCGEEEKMLSPGEKLNSLCSGMPAEQNPSRRELWVLHKEYEEDAGRVQQALYNKQDSVLINGKNDFVRSLSELSGATPVVATLQPGSARKLKQSEKSLLELRPLSAYDELALRLQEIHNRFVEAPDISSLTVVADDEVAFDKVIQVMDRARTAGFSNVSLARLGG